MSLIRKNNGAISQGPVYGDDVVPGIDRGFGLEVAVAAAKFWQKDEIRGWDENGERIGTGIPRVRPTDRGSAFDWFFVKKKNRRKD